MKKQITGAPKFYPSKLLPKDKEFRAYLVGWYNGGQYPEINNLKLKALDPFPTVETKTGKINIAKDEVFILNVHGQLKYFKENCNQQSVNPIGCLLFITYTGDKKNKRNQTVAQFNVSIDDEEKTSEILEFPSDEEIMASEEF